MQQVLLGAVFASVLWLGAFGISVAVVEWRSGDEATLSEPVDTRAERCASAVLWWDESKALPAEKAQTSWDTMWTVCHSLED